MEKEISKKIDELCNEVLKLEVAEKQNTDTDRQHRFYNIRVKLENAMREMGKIEDEERGK